MTLTPTSSASEQPDIGLWAERLTTIDFAGRPGLFLDRDGVIVEETHYLHRVEDVVSIPGVALAIAEANRRGIPVVIVTNQAGIGRGRYGWDAFAAVQNHLREKMREQNAGFDMVLACAYHPDGRGDYAIADHPWRKPRPGMLLKAAQMLRLDLDRSFIVGDRMSDLMAGLAAGLTAGALTLTGYGAGEFADHRDVLDAWHADGRFRVDVAASAGIAIGDWLGRL